MQEPTASFTVVQTHSKEEVMKPKSRKPVFAGIAVLLVFFLILPVVAQDITITIKVAPNVLNLASQGEVVTVHTDLPYSQVVVATVSLNGIEIQSWKSDSRGNFVAKFNMNDIKDLPLMIDAYNTVTLAGTTVNQQNFSGSQSILVVHNIPQGR